MAVNNPYQQYKQNTVDTKSPGELTLMLYDGCLKFIKRAEVAITDKQIEVKNEHLLKAQNIIRELMLTLNTEITVSQDMMMMYDYILSQLIEANTKNDLDALKEAEKYVSEFRDTWKEVIKVDRQQRHTGETSSEAANGTKGKQPNLKAVDGSGTKKASENEPQKTAETTAAASATEKPAGKNVPPNPNNPYAKAKTAGYGAPNNPYTKAKQAAANTAGPSGGGTSFQG
ncbi:Flagellar biosynthesis protein FliS [Salisediminibacterium beveridgei]|uniref:Flagellar biosynthesis protein FliS n=1 Tax=Salisediminibacterium beveridgei TaxID=632773 RepID=A0A1D7QSD4_9BACI|nr:Flagellar biosynthesis protein FliS [Salisediminibacterium beveridgei]